MNEKEEIKSTITPQQALSHNTGRLIIALLLVVVIAVLLIVQ